MTKSELMKIITEIVRKEVQKEVNRIFIKENKPIVSKSKSKVVSKPIKKKEEKLSKNPVLNKILNETKGGIPGETGYEPYPTMTGETFDTNRMAELVGYGDTTVAGNDETKRQIAAVQTVKEAGVSVDDVGEGVMNALTRDYSGVMKALNNKGK